MSQQNILAASVSALSLDESTVHTGGASSKKVEDLTEHIITFPRALFLLWAIHPTLHPN